MGCNMAEQKSQAELEAEAEKAWKEIAGDNDVIDRKEYAAYVSKNYGLTADEAEESFKHWDLSEDGKINRQEFDLMQIHVLTAVMEGTLKLAEDAGTIVQCTIFAWCCLLCTLGISYLIFWCWLTSKTKEYITDAVRDRLKKVHLRTLKQVSQRCDVSK